jgi:type I restriction enzyme S subunit
MNVTRTYSKYKSSGIEWLGELPEHWELMRTKFVAKTIMGQSPSSDAYTFDESVKPFLQGNAEFGMQYPSPKYYCQEAMKEAPEESILVSVRAPVGALNIADRPYGIGRGLCAVVPNSKSIIQRFAWYLLTITRNELWGIATGSTYEAVSADEVASMTLTVPTLEEQRAIAAFLDRETARINALIEKKQRQIELLQEKRSALITHAVTKGLDPNAKMKDSGIEWLGEIPAHWEVKSIRRIAKTVKTGGTPSGAEEIHFDENGFNWYTPSDFYNDVILAESSRKLSEIGKREVRVFPAMTVMMIGIGATIGKVALSREGSSCNQQINAIVCNSKMTPKFLTYFLRIMREYIYRCGKFTTLPIINQEDTKALIITCPPLPEQDEIVSVLDKEMERTEALIGKIQISIDKLCEYRTALISAAVTGKIDVHKEVA